MKFDEKNDAALVERHAASEEIFDGIILHLFRDKVTLPNGKDAVREVIRHVGAVCVIPVFENGDVLVERQFRYPHREVLLEIPAGKLDSKEEEPLAAAKRELYEETGYCADKFTRLGLLYTTPAFVDEVITMYLAEGLHSDSNIQHLDADEFLTVEKIHIDTLADMVMNSEIPDAKTQIAVLKAKRILDERKK